MLSASHTSPAVEEPPPAGTRIAIQLHLITCEFPPQPGGVGDYTHSVARDLAAAGDDVHVWCPESRAGRPELPGVTVHEDLGRLSIADLHRVNRNLNQFAAPRRILVQWVPHGYRYKSVNLPFCLWVWKRARFHGDRVELMVHEAFLTFNGGTWRQAVAAAVHRIMTTFLLAAASKVWLATSSWEPMLRPYCFRRNIPFHSLPVPSNIPVHSDPHGVASVRERYAPRGEVLLGHFGSYGRPIAEMLTKLIPPLFETPGHHSLLLMGKSSREFRYSLIAAHPQWAERISAAGALDPSDLSCHIQACDLMVQPYPDGITTRRTSAMVSLSHGRPVVTTRGHLTEPFWQTSEALAIEPAQDIPAMVQRVRALIHDDSKRRALGEAARRLYADRLDLTHTITAISARR